eukprot:9160937-Pyramimonas_sp.AAC.1
MSDVTSLVALVTGLAESASADTVVSVGLTCEDGGPEVHVAPIRAPLSDDAVAPLCQYREDGGPE